MKRFFLYKLFTASKPWFVFCVLFTFVYGFFFIKKMDTVFTPYNGMFAFVNTSPHQTSTIAIKLNKVIIPYTNNLWWKKDFFENSLGLYSRYMLGGKKVALNDYIENKLLNADTKKYLVKILTPDSLKIKSYPTWLVNFAKYKVGKNAVLEFVKYDFKLFNGTLTLVDSSNLISINSF